MATKVIVELMMLVSISAMFLAHQACGEPDCHTEKLSVMIHCIRTIKHNRAYHFPTRGCTKIRYPLRVSYPQWRWREENKRGEAC